MRKKEWIRKYCLKGLSMMIEKEGEGGDIREAVGRESLISDLVR